VLVILGLADEFDIVVDRFAEMFRILPSIEQAGKAG
jgi:hypothetical protein